MHISPSMFRLFCPLLGLLAVGWSAQAAPVRQLKIAVSDHAPEEIQAAAKRILAAVPAHPLLREMAIEYAPRYLLDTAQLAADPATSRAYSHLVIIGLPDDPLVAAAWQREARPSSQPGGWYAFGYGELSGDIGWVESDRNPFLHSAAIDAAPFETHVITLSGSTPRGVALAVDAFLQGGLINGLVAAPGWQRNARTLLDHDPLAPAAAPPFEAPATLGSHRLVGWIQPNEEEYRGVEEDTGRPPLEIVRFKYYTNGDWDHAGAKFARTSYLLGLHRRAYGNTLWVARFASPAEAEAAAGRMAGAARLRPSGATQVWRGTASPHSDDPSEPAVALELWSTGDRVYMSTLPLEPTRKLRSRTATGK